MSFNFTDFNIVFNGHPRYQIDRLAEDDPIRVILQKYEVLLFTNKGDVFGEPNLGCDLEYLLHETKVATDYVEAIIEEQIQKYIPEISGVEYSLNVNFYEDPERFQNWMEVNFQLKDYEVYLAVG